jgi:hypothetical protein
MTSVQDFMRDYIARNGPPAGVYEGFNRNTLRLLLDFAEAYADRREMEVLRSLDKEEK